MSVFIIAEVGVNHNGHLALAKQLIDAAVSAGADAVKFQTFKAERVISKNAPKAAYQEETTGTEESQLEMVRKLELSEDDHCQLIRYCHEKNIMFLSTPFDLISIQLLNKLGLEVIKIPSGEITNLPYLRAVGCLSKKVILSTGMSNLDEIGDALRVLIAEGTPKGNITVLHCNTAYPTPIEDVNLRAMITIRDTFRIAVGYSDHSLGIEVPIAAVALGAAVIEKHITLDKSFKGPDHRASLDPIEFKQMVTGIRNIECALGDGIRRPSPSEMENIEIARKSIFAARDIKRGDVLTEENLTVKRPGTGISAMDWDKVLGLKAKTDFKEDELIQL